ncbi:MAG: hypothetical protein QM698_06280 [Micropepsaceae bacterium]
MTAYVYVIADGERHHVQAAEGDFTEIIAAHDAELGKPAILLWAEAVDDLAQAQELVPLIEALDDERYAALLAGEDEARSLLVRPTPTAAND